jgi:hypothetical protein
MGSVRLGRGLSHSGSSRGQVYVNAALSFKIVENQAKAG